MTVPSHMLAAVYHGRRDVRVEEVPVPAMPPAALASAVRAGTAVGLPVDCEACADAGLDSAVGDAASSADRRVRAGSSLA